MRVLALLPALAALSSTVHASYPTTITDTSSQPEPFFLRITAELISDVDINQALYAGRNIQLAPPANNKTTVQQVVVDSSSPVLGLKLVNGTLHALEFNSNTGWTDTGLVGVLAPYKEPTNSPYTTTAFEFVPGNASTPNAKGWNLLYTQSVQNTYYALRSPAPPSSTLYFNQICPETSSAGQTYFTLIEYIYYGYIPDRARRMKRASGSTSCLTVELETTLSPPLNGQS